MNTLADKQWHYTCVDIYQGILKSWATTAEIYPAYRLTLIQVCLLFNLFLSLYYFIVSLIQAWVSPVVNDMYIDVVSIRNSIPSNIDGKLSILR